MEIEIGKILKPQGIKGELKVLPLSDAEFFKSIKLIKINGTESKIQSVSIRDGFVFLKIDACNDRDTAENLRDTIITSEKSDLPDLKEGQYFYEDLIGCHVYLSNGEYAGEIIDIENYGNADIFNIHKDFNTILCPYIKGIFIEIDIQNKKITADEKKYKEVTDYED